MKKVSVLCRTKILFRSDIQHLFFTLRGVRRERRKRRTVTGKMASILYSCSQAGGNKLPLSSFFLTELLLKIYTFDNSQGQATEGIRRML
jgi:hypothetical protein